MNDKSKGTLLTVFGVVLTLSAAAAGLFGPKLFNDGQIKLEQDKLNKQLPPASTPTPVTDSELFGSATEVKTMDI